MLDMPTGSCLLDDSAVPAVSAVPDLPSTSPSCVLVRVEGALAAACPARECWRARLLCFGRTMLVGFWANVLDFGLLALCLRWLHIEALSSRVIALVISGLVTFIGSRSFAFRVTGGNVPQQAGRFIAAEAAALPLNLLSFQLCSLCAPDSAAEVVSFVANAVVFVAFSYPVRRLLVFGGATPSALSREPAFAPRVGSSSAPCARR